MRRLLGQLAAEENDLFSEVLNRSAILGVNLSPCFVTALVFRPARPNLAV